MNSSNVEWWRGGVIYQIYPRSFLDTNQDGIGDLAGITQKLDYVAELGVDAIWLSPFFTSPMKDFGYDISDYCNVDPMFGDLNDFKTLLQKAQGLGLKIMIDQVLNHTSDQHPWFEESRQNHDNPKSDWYVWADANPDGTPPTNWMSVFGGSAWQWDSRRKQYYLHNFLASQPDLNFHNPEVVDAVLETVKFWLELGVDGFRLDTANFYYHDAELRNNPPREEVAEGGIGVRLDNPYGFQLHLYDKSRPENIRFLTRFRALLDQYPNTTSVGEVGCDFSLKTMAAYTQGTDKLHMCYSFDLLTADSSMNHVRKTMESIEAGLGDGWPCWSISNHDVERVASRWGNGVAHAEQAKIFMAMLLCLRGSVCLYQGEELGLAEAELAYEDLVDPYGITFWPEFKGRDGCRTPMPWDASEQAGFSQHKPWLPVVDSHLQRSVASQTHDELSVLSAYRDFLALRKQRPELVSGDICFFYSSPSVLLFERSLAGVHTLIALNTGDQPAKVDLSALLLPGAPVSAKQDIVLPVALQSGEFQGGVVSLPPYSVYLGELATGLAEFKLPQSTTAKQEKTL